MTPLPYTGRFAPTPSGPLHPGSLLTALASWLQARAAQGRWLLRIDDLDAGRCRPEHADAILRQLEAHGLHWDAAPRRQSQHLAEYEAAFGQLRTRGLLFACTCTRAQLAQQSRSGVDGPVYAGTCRGRQDQPGRAAWRLRAGAGSLVLDDPWQGPLRRDIEQDIGDFTVRRADGVIGYQLACAVDEQAQGITEVVRGADLIGSSFRQILLQGLLQLPSPAYRHLPVLVDADGRKLSKQNHAAPVQAQHAAGNLLLCLHLLQQSPPSELQHASAGDVLRWALAHWQPARVPAKLQIPAARPAGALGEAPRHLAS